MNKRLITLFLLIIVTFDLNAATKERGPYATNNFKGQKYYLNACSSCHGEGSRGGNMESIREWEALFSKNGKELLELHIDEEKTKEVILYLKSNKFLKEKIRMMPFLQEFAYDSENIPTCY